MQSNSAHALCTNDIDPDWPTKPPCLGEGPIKPSLEKMREAWDGYYQYKGKELIDTKKIEMDNAIKDGNLQQWINLSVTNQHMWYYYWINGQAPNPYGASLDAVFDTSSPSQIHTWIVGGAALSTAVGGSLVYFFKMRKRQG